MSFLRRQSAAAAPPPPRPVDPADTANRADDARQRRLRSGGRQSTFLSTIAAEAATAGPVATLTGVGG